VRADLTVLTGTYDFRLLAVSAVLAILMPYAGFAVIERARISRAATRWSWILAGGMAIGFGFCAALDFGILALTLSVPVRYHYPTLLLSVLLGMVCGAAGVYAATRKHDGVGQAFAASCLIGPSGAVISYLCVRSFRMAGVVEYRWGLMAVSGVFAVLAFLLVLVFALGVQRSQSLSVLRHLMISVVTGAALVALPFGILHSVRFHGSPVEVAIARTFARSFGSLTLLAGIAFCVLSGTILVATLDRALSSQEEVLERVRERESFFNNLAEAIPGIVWIADAGGQTTYINRNWYEMTGTDPAQEL